MPKTPKTEKLEELDDSTMNELLLALSTSEYWPAILKYNIFRYTQVDNGLRTIDPFKAPTEMARTQGFFGGITDLNKYIDELKKKSIEAEKTTIE